MLLNLITDQWIPVLRSGQPVDISPDQIAESGVECLNWPRPDLNLACLEMLIGLIYMADPPKGATDWQKRRPDAGRLRKALAPYAPAFNLTAKKQEPLFLQDFDPLEGEPKSPDMLFIDSAGENALRNNTDLMVKRTRYREVPLPLAAMALYTLQAFAPSGGQGNRTSMRGGGPLVTLIRPGDAGESPLWAMVWANVPRGKPLPIKNIAEALPWMRPTRTSEKKDHATYPPQDQDFVPLEAFFGMPRRLRLCTDETYEVITGVIQKNYGTEYEGWEHPLTPYYRKKNETEKLPKHPQSGSFGYHNWLGVLMEVDESATLAQCVYRFQQENPRCEATVLVGGWAMDNMKPLDFVWSEEPLFILSSEAKDNAVAVVHSAEQASSVLSTCLYDALGANEKKTANTTRIMETFFERTQGAFISVLKTLQTERALSEQIANHWVREMKEVGMDIFDHLVLPSLPEHPAQKQERQVQARQKLLLGFLGYKPFGPKIFGHLDLPIPSSKKKEAA